MRKIHESHVMVVTPVDTDECKKCWACTCHQWSDLEQECPGER